MRNVGLILLCFFTCVLALTAQERKRRPREAISKEPVKETTTDVSSKRTQQDQQIAAQFAPVVYQGLGENARADFITNFDFDGDWRGDNNWGNLANRQYALRGYVYYSVCETPTHYFVHYAFFHPRDYKGDIYSSTLLDSVLRQTIPQLGKDRSVEKINDVALSHENDLEGCLVVAAKRGNDLAQAQVQYVEAMAHNAFLKYYAAGTTSTVGDLIELDGLHPRLFIEPKGHGVVRYTGDNTQLNQHVKSVLVYRFTGKAEEPSAQATTAEYDLVALYDTLWQRAQQGANETFGETLDYQTRVVQRFASDNPTAKVEQTFNQLGSAFLGKVGFKNKARPPWAWYDEAERERPRGEWFFDPAAVIGRHFKMGQEWSGFYSYHRYFNIQ